MKKFLLVLIFLVGLFWIFRGPIPLPGQSPIATGDFTAYWSAAYLLAHGQNFSDSALLLETERTLAGFDLEFTVKTWNPPWLLPLLIPYTGFAFSRAVWLWLLTNIVLIFTGAVITWLACARDTAVKKQAWLAPIIAFLFAPTLTALYMGQVNTLVFFGLALTLWGLVKERQVLAGLGLSLTMVKPHLVYLTVSVLLLRALYYRQWRFLAGFGGSLLVLTGITFLLRPTFVREYLTSAAGGGLLQWATPTLGGFLGSALGWHWAILMGVLVLPLVIIGWWWQRDRIPVIELLQMTLLISVITAPFGWGYDAIVLLIPMIQIFVWVFEKAFSRIMSVGFVVALLAIDVLIFYHRTVMVSEVEVFWVPIAIAVLYFAARFFKQRRQLAV